MGENESRKLFCMSCGDQTNARTQKGLCKQCQIRIAMSCGHWEMAFCVVGDTILVECRKCDIKSQVKLDGAYTFTTSRAKIALASAIEQEVSHA